MTPNLKLAFSSENLLRSWNWVNTSNNNDYKKYFRTLYKAYGLSASENLKDLKERLDKNIYVPSSGVKIYYPKKSGILRAYTLLSIEDQIVYQALVSIIAKRYSPFIPSSKDQISFSNRYSNEKNTFFYKKWTTGYKAFNKRVVGAYESGFDILASFDLSAFYDSICHKVLGHMISKLKIEPEFIQMLCTCLEKWSSNDNSIIYHGHGIPQGPFSSGLLSELLLNNFDEAAQHDPFSINEIVYARYVDDIRLMAKDEYRLRKCLVELDYISKKIGPFPQSNKIDIHKIDDIFDEIKSVSLSPIIAELFGEKITTQTDIFIKINEIIKGGRIKDETTLKYLLGFAKADDKLNKKLLKLLNKNPHLFMPIFRYLGKTKKFSKSTSDVLFTNMNYTDVYEEITAKYLQIAIEKIHVDMKEEFLKYSRHVYKKINSIQSIELRSLIISWLINNGEFNFAAVDSIIESENPKVVQNIADYINIDSYGLPSYQHLMNKILCSEDKDTALKAAYICITKNLEIKVKSKEINDSAKTSLKLLGKINTKTGRKSTISESMELITGLNKYRFDWKKLFGSNHKNAEIQIFICRSYAQNDATAFVNQLDVFHDFLLDSIYRKDPLIGKYNLGKIGYFLHAKTGKLATKYPYIFLACNKIHDLRYKSNLSHPLINTTARPTSRITFAEIRKIKPILDDAYLEVTSNF